MRIVCKVSRSYMIKMIVFWEGYIMKVFFRMIIAVLAFIILLLLDNFPSGGGVKDPWDDLVRWAKKKKI